MRIRYLVSMLKSTILPIYLLFFCNSVFAIETHLLRERAFKEGLKPAEILKGKEKDLFQLGKSLFFENELSGNRNISCATCHHPRHGSGDGLMLGLGQGTDLIGKQRVQGKSSVLKRHSPHLVNVGYPDVKLMFWDGRVSYRPETNVYRTPEAQLNGPSPVLSQITQQLDGALAAQALFPILSREEMRGHKGENEIADAKTNQEAWKLLVQRIVKSRKYIVLLSRAFPGKKIEEINIGHFAKAIAHFQRYFFASHDTPLDRFLKGSDQSLSDIEKLGLEIFAGKGKCTHCHTGAHLTNFTFQSVGAPQVLQPGVKDDLGREDVTRKKRSRYKFKTPGLRNIALTAPYFHSGAVDSLKELVEHYNSIGRSISQYQISIRWEDIYSTSLSVDEDRNRNRLRILQTRPTPVRIGLNLSEEEKDALVHFLKFSLTDQSFKERMERHSL